MEEVQKIFQALISSQDEFKQVILSEPDAEKHPELIDKYTAEEQSLADSYNKALEEYIKSLGATEVDPEVIDEQEDNTNTNDNHPLLNTFKKLVDSGASPLEISKQFRESELIEIGDQLKLEFTSKGTKLEKVQLIIKALNR